MRACGLRFIAWGKQFDEKFRHKIELCFALRCKRFCICLVVFPKCRIILIRRIASGRRFTVCDSGKKRRDCVQIFSHGRSLPFSGLGYAIWMGDAVFFDVHENGSCKAL